MVAVPGGAGPRAARAGRATRGASQHAAATDTSLPIVHILIPADFRRCRTRATGTAYDWENMHAGLDGIAIDLPALNMKPTHGDVIPMNIQIKDPIWPMRDMLDFNFSVKPGEPHTLVARHARPHSAATDKSLYLTIASASPEFGAGRSKARRCGWSSSRIRTRCRSISPTG